MKVLTKTEENIIDQYLIKNNMIVDQAHFLIALNNTLPTWRTEQVIDPNNHTKNYAYTHYIKKLKLENFDK